MDGLEHVADFTNLSRRDVTEHVPAKMHHAALPASIGQKLRDALKQTTAGIGNDQLNPFEAATNQVSTSRSYRLLKSLDSF